VLDVVRLRGALVDRTRMVAVLAVVGSLLALSIIGLVNSASAAGTGSISGTVWGTKGPLAGALVSANKGFQSYAIATTDELGHYTLTGLAAGSFGVQFTPPANTDLLVKSYKTPVAVVADKTTSRIDGWLEAAGYIEGVATGPDGTYVGNASVCFYRQFVSEPPVTTTTGGSSTSTTMPTSSTSGVPTTPTSTTTIPATTTSTSGATTTVIGPTTSAPGTTFPGTITFPPEDPENPSYSCTTMTNAAGRYRSGKLSPGRYTVSFQPQFQLNLYGYYDNDAPPATPYTSALDVTNGTTISGVNAVMRSYGGNCTQLSSDCTTRYSNQGCAGVTRVGVRQVELEYFCTATTVEWAASDGQNLVGKKVVMTFATDGPITVNITATVSSTAVQDSLAFSFKASDPAPTAPGAPRGLVATAGIEQAVVSWVRPADDGHSPISSYKVTASPGGAVCNWTSGPRSCTFKDLAPGTPYTFTATATNGVGTGPASEASAPVAPLTRRFGDVPLNHVFYGHIDWLASEQITTGFPDGTYRGSQGVQRQAMAAFLYRLAGSPNGKSPACGAAPFTDVGVGAPFCGEISWLKGTGITTGSPDGTFRPTDSVSRGAMAAFLYRFMGSPNGASPTCAVAPFTDVPVGAPFCGEITWLKGTGITTGFNDGTYRPTNPVSREAMAAFLHRLPR